MPSPNTLPEKNIKYSLIYQSQEGLCCVVRVTNGDGYYPGITDYIVRYVANSRIFNVEKIEPGKSTVYLCVMDEEGNDSYCGCDRNGVYHSCEHRRMIRELIRQGVFS